MRIEYSQLKKLKVETVSGTVLGYVNDIIIDVNTHSILQYKVKSSVLRTKEYLIHKNQVVSIKEDKVVVEDNVEKEAKKVNAGVGGRAKAEPIAMREEV